MNSLSQMSLAQKLDMPPFWLAGFAALAYLIAQIDPWRAGVAGMGVMQWAGFVLLGLGAVLMFWSIRHMGRAKTTVIPHLEPQHLVTDGPFSFSRNPIYLADALMLTGFILQWWQLLVS
jgi:protein-S-isoprenylcysteine O-methyltransferase Ste14